ncbi:G patch domain-containing protein 8 isoform X1 [Scyliorhinus canicula]|uniref:G patch domain-containing protein 8 isoform X1 n=1 Tax=Scyliorhinus canicula TaxID=7830 RepID=UPI0018F2D63D|nr:G patch domain-containing protein 8 isoform X1 [Scyliorhinus canicula]
MACYYLVISSTHLSNGHFRSIKGVFRGPLCKKGSESLDYAGKEKAIAKALEDLKANFYCELCDKQYHKHQEFDNHINSYDHAHKQRLKELKQREFARNVASRSRKDEKKQEKALKRLHQLAELRKQSECAPGSGPMFKPTTVAIDSHSKRNPAGSIAKGRDNGRKSNTRASFKKEETLRKNLENSLQCSPCGDQCAPDKSAAQIQGQLGLKPFSLFKNKSSACIPAHKGSVSFSFSKKAPLKLESSASVFNDTIEEKQHGNEPQNHKGKVAAEPEMPVVPAGINNTAHTENNEAAKQSQVDSGIRSNPFARVRKLKALMLKENKDEEEKEYYCYTPTLCKTKPNFPFLFFMKSSEKTDADQVTTRSDNIKEFQTGSTDFKCSMVSEVRDVKLEVTDSVPQLNPPACQQATKQEDGKPLDQDVCKPKGEEPSMLNAKQREPVQTADERLGRMESSSKPKKVTEPFLPVLSRDESTTLQWPSELLLFTQTEPYLSYSCNPLYFDFKLSGNKKRANGIPGPEPSKQQSATVAIGGDNETGVKKAQTRSVQNEEDLEQRKRGVSRKSKKRKSHQKSSRKSKQKSEAGQADNGSKKRKGKIYNRNLKKEGKYACKETDPVSQNAEEDSKEEKHFKLTPKRSEELVQVDSSIIKKQSFFPFDLSNKKQKVSPTNSLSSSKEMCEGQKVHKSTHDSLNLNSHGTDSTEERHRNCRKSSSRCSYQDDSESNRSACRKSRSDSSSHGSSFRSSSDTSSDRSRTSHSSRNYSDRSSDDSHRSRSRYCSKRHHKSHYGYKCHSRLKKKRHSRSSMSSLSSDNDHYHRKGSASRSRNRGSSQRQHTCPKGRMHSGSRNSSSSRAHSRSRSRYRSRSKHCWNRQESPIRDYLSSSRPSLRRSSSQNKEECRQELPSERQARHSSTRSFSKDRAYHVKPSLCYRHYHEVKRETGVFHGTIKSEDTIQNYTPMSPSLFQKNESIGSSILPLKEMIQDVKKPLTTEHLLETMQRNKIEEKTFSTADLTSTSNALVVNLKDHSKGYCSPSLPPSMDNMALVSLIGKLAPTEKVGLKNDISKGDNSDKADEPELSKENGNEAVSAINQEESLVLKEVNENKTDIGQGSMCSITQTAEEEQAGLTNYHVQPAEENVTPVPEGRSSVDCSVCTDDSMVVKEENSQKTFYNSGDINSVPMGEVMFDYYNTNSESVDEMDPPFMEGSKSISPPLASQPIIFTPEEMEKYSKLQLQAQQHIQQQLLSKQVKTFPSSAASVTFSPVPAFQPISLPQPSATAAAAAAAAASSVTTVHHTLLQHHAAATLTAALHPNAHHQAMAQLHHLTQPYIAPFTFSPITQTIFPAHPAAFLAGHPLHFIPAAAIHPAHLALHPLPHTTLCPTLFAPHPAAAAAASAIHLHPLLHPLFPGHDLQHRSSPNT